MKHRRGGRAASHNILSPVRLHDWVTRAPSGIAIGASIALPHAEKREQCAPRRRRGDSPIRLPPSPTRLGAISALSRHPSGGPVAERRLRVRGPRASAQRRDRIRIQWRRRSGRIRILTAPRVSGTWHPMVARPPTVSRLSNWQAGRELYLADRLSQRKRDCISQIVSRRGCTRAPHTGTGASQARAALMAWAATARCIAHAVHAHVRLLRRRRPLLRWLGPLCWRHPMQSLAVHLKPRPPAPDVLGDHPR